MNDFLKTLINNYSVYFKKTYDQEKYPNQDENSCEFLYNACMDVNPDYIIDIGTNFGASTLSLAYALTRLGHNLETLTTIDYSHIHWETVTPVIQKNILEESGIDIKKIVSICKDFKAIDPLEIIKKDARYLIFFDIHDTLDFSFSSLFLDSWIPLVPNSFICMHDFSAVPETFQLIQGIDKSSPRTKARHFSGQLFSGFKECETVIDWMNINKIMIESVPNTSIIHFKTR